MDPVIVAALITGGLAAAVAVLTALLQKDIIIIPSFFRWKRRVPYGFVLLINGGSGVGKTTLAWALARKLNIVSVFGSDIAREVLRDRVLAEHPPEQRTLLRSSFEAYQEMGLVTRTTQGTIDAFVTQSSSMLSAVIRVINRIRRKRDPVIIEGVNILASQIFSAIPNDPHSKVFLINLFLSSKDVHLKRLRERGQQSGESDLATERYIRNIEPIRDIDTHLRSDSSNFVGGLTGVPTNVISFDNSHGLHEAIDKATNAIAKRIRWLKEQGIN